MEKLKLKINKFYPINLMEDEGVGVTYEYYVKWQMLNKVFMKFSKPKSILVAGLPGKYGLSLDFIFLAQHFNASVTIIDEREDKINKFSKIIEELKEKKVLTIDIKIIKVNFLEKPMEIDNSKFDYIFNSETLQRLNDQQRIDFAKNILPKSKHSILFVPNSGNEAHAKVSKINTMSIDELRLMVKSLPIKIWKSGYLDLPPFPPGLERSDEQRQRAKSGGLERVLMKILEIWGNLEKLMPRFIKYKKAHLAYVILIYG